MKGLELSQKYYEEYGKPMIHLKFPEYEGVIAAGLTGAGSECFGFDDEISRDHDFDMGFCLFIPGEDVVDSRTHFQLERAYAKLPSEFEGITRMKISPVGGNRRGVIRAADFFAAKTGHEDGQLSVTDRFKIPDEYLAEAVNGKIFRDDTGYFTAVREQIKAIPDDVIYKKLAGHLLLCAQSGQYNFRRCIGHGEPHAASLCKYEFINNACACLFLLKREYMPYYKWRFRAMEKFTDMAETTEKLTELLDIDENDKKAQYDKTEDICADIISYLKAQGITDAVCLDLEKHAYSVNDKVRDASLRNESIFYGV